MASTIFFLKWLPCQAKGNREWKGRAAKGQTEEEDGRQERTQLEGKRKYLQWFSVSVTRVQGKMPI